MMLFILGVLIGSVGGMIMMAMLLSGKSREASFNEYKNMFPSNTDAKGPDHDNAEKP